MRFRLYFELENEHFPIQYRKSILSFIKLSLTQYSEEYYNKLYHEKDNIIKPYTFAVFFHHPQFKAEEIVLEDKRFEMTISIADSEIAVALYNAFNHQKQKKFSLNHNSWTLKNITMLMEKQEMTETMQIKLLSPLVVRSRQNQKDYYYSYQHQEFLDILRINIKEQLRITNLSEKLADSFMLEAVNAKKTVIKFYEKSIECSLGVFQISGETDLLKYLYQAGIGSKRSSGFGMFEIL